MRYLEKLNACKQELDRALQRQIKLTEQIFENEKKYEERNPDLNSDKKQKRMLNSESIEVLKGEQEKLNNFDVVLAVVGTMKAGKSTVINAIVGRELMPNRNTPMTALPTLIRHQSNPNHAVLRLEVEAVNQFLSEIKNKLPSQKELQNIFEIEYLLKLAEKIGKNQAFQFKKEYQGAENVIVGLSALNDLVRLSQILGNKVKEFPPFPFEEYRNIQHLPEICLPFEQFLTQENQSSHAGKLSLLDTPGPNEAGQHTLKRMLNEQLKRSSAVLLILDYTQLGSEATDEVKRQIDQLPNIEADRLFIAVNKYDQKDANSLDESGVKKAVKGLLKNIKIEEENIFPISARNAYLANRMASLLASAKKPSLQEIKDTKGCYKWVEDFANLALGPTWEKKWDKQSEEEIKEDIINIRETSFFPVLMKKAIESLWKKAPYIAMESTLANIEGVFEESKKYFKIQYSILNKSNKELLDMQKTLESLKKNIQDLEKQNGPSIYMLGKKNKEIRKEVEAEIKKYSEQIANGVNKLISGEIDKILNGDRIRGIQEKGYLKFKANGEYEDGWEHYSENEIRVRNKDDFISYLDRLIEDCSEVIQQECKEIVTPKLKVLQEEVDAMDKSVRDLFLKTQENLKDIQIDIEWSCPSFEDFQVSQMNSTSLNFDFKSEGPKTIYHEQEGAWGATKRFIANLLSSDLRWGYDESEVDGADIFKIKKFEVQLSNYFQDEFLKQIESNLRTYFKKNSAEVLHQYVEAMQERNKQLIAELETASHMANSDVADKTELIHQLRSFIRENEDIQSEIKVVHEFISPSQQN